MSKKSPSPPSSNRAVPGDPLKSVVLRPTSAGRLASERAMRDRGAAFIAAAELLRESGGDGFAVLHLYAQGIELIGKALLRFRCRTRSLGKPNLIQISHDLVRLDDALRRLGPGLGFQSECLSVLSARFKDHSLRYGTLEALLSRQPAIDLAELDRGTLALIVSARDELGATELPLRPLARRAH